MLKADHRQNQEDQSEEVAAFLGGQGGVVTAAADTPPQDSRGSDTATSLPPAQLPPAQLPPPQLPPPDVDTKPQNSDEGPLAGYEYPMSPSQGEPSITTAAQTDQSEHTATDTALAHVLPTQSVGYNPAPSAPPPLATPPLSNLPTSQLPAAAYQQAPPPTYNQMVGVVSATGIHPLPPVQFPPPAVQVRSGQGDLG